MASSDVFLRACRGEPTERVPVWFMRQAGRSLPEYRTLRERFGILEMCSTPSLAAEVTLQPLRRYRVDAAILFSDIVIPLQAMGISVEIKEGIGPVIADPIRSERDLARLHPLDPTTGVPHVGETIRQLVSELDVPLIGFAGAPFTLACYLVDGGPSRTHARTKALMYSAPALWDALMDRLAISIGAYLRAQVAEGAAAVQLFDSWAGTLSPDDYRRYAMPASRKVLDSLGDQQVPRIHFALGSSFLLEAIHETGAEVMGVDWTLPLDEARRRTRNGVALQGNLDPSLCLAPWAVLEERAVDVLRRGEGRAHVFNLGHGVLPESDPGVLGRLVDLVHGWQPG